MWTTHAWYSVAVTSHCHCLHICVGLSRAPSAVQLMREDVLELVGHKPWEEGS